MNQELEITLNQLKSKRDEVLELMNHLNSPLAKRDRYKQLTKLNNQISVLERKKNIR